MIPFAPGARRSLFWSARSGTVGRTRGHRHGIYAIYHPDLQGGNFRAGKTRNGSNNDYYRCVIILYNK